MLFIEEGSNDDIIYWDKYNNSQVVDDCGRVIRIRKMIQVPNFEFHARLQVFSNIDNGRGYNLYHWGITFKDMDGESEFGMEAKDFSQCIYLASSNIDEFKFLPEPFAIEGNFVFDFSAGCISIKPVYDNDE